MAVKSKGAKKSAQQVLSEETVIRIAGKVVVLLNKHRDDIAKYLNGSEDKKTTVNFSVKLDLSETEPSVDVGIRFSQSVTDHLVIPLAKSDDPNQLPLIPRTDDENPSDLSDEEQKALIEASSDGSVEVEEVSAPRKGKRKRKA